MACISPPELEIKLLMAFLDGEADPETTLHLQQCDYCRDRAKTLEREQKRLTSQLYRASCPSTDELGEFHLRMLPASQTLVVGQHLRECPHCAHELSQLEEFLNEPTTQPGLLKSVNVLIARLVRKPGMGQDSGGLLGAPTFAGLRGEEDEPFIYQAGDIRIVIEVQDDVEQMGFKTLLGLVTGLDTNEFTIQVSQENQVINISSVDEIGNFIIPRLSPGHYKLILSGPNMEIHVQSLPVL